ncbi:chaperonin 10-like protein [Mariannaea sp. PMI_226]|nr:chaperonin 10-like protein [Mariannaea sp. PMI_226]
MEGASNLSFYLNHPGEVSFADRPIPELQSPHDVLLAINYTGVCGSDVHFYRHGGVAGSVIQQPIVLGHEAVGTVVQVGSKVTSLLPGDRVAVEPGFPCRRCEACLSGKYNLCEDMVFAASPPYHGTLTGFFVAADDFCYKLPDHVSLHEGALAEPLAVAVHIVRLAQITPGTSVIIFGAGPVGLLCASVARVYGAATVVCVDIVQLKLDVAKEFAATHVVLPQSKDPSQNAAHILQAAGLGRAGADVAIDASGAELSIQTALHATRRGGTFVQGGMGKADISFPIMAMCMKEITAHGSFRYSSGDFKLALDLIGSGQVKVSKLITGIVNFRSAEGAIRKVSEGGVIKLLIAGPNEVVEDEFIL